MKKILLATTALMATAPAYAWDKGICHDDMCTYTIVNRTQYQDPIHNEIQVVMLTDTSVKPPAVDRFVMKLDYGHEATIAITEKGGCKRNLAIYLHRWPGTTGSGPLSKVFDTTVMADASHAPYQFDVCHMRAIIVSGDHTITYK